MQMNGDLGGGSATFWVLFELSAPFNIVHHSIILDYLLWLEDGDTPCYSSAPSGVDY